MKTISRRKSRRVDARTAKVLKAMRDARHQAVKSARMHQVPIVYLHEGKIVRERP